MQYQVPQIIIGIGRVLYHIKALWMMISKYQMSFLCAEKNKLEILDFNSNF